MTTTTTVIFGEANLDKPNYESPQFKAMKAALQIVRDARRGTLAVRAAGAVYLPQFPREPADAYDDRLKAAVFLNLYQKNEETMAGLVFQKDIVLGADVPEIIARHAESIDNAGTHIAVFAKNAFEQLFDGHCFIVVDMPPKNSSIQTLADERAAGLRPYWYLYRAENCINWDFARINGETVLTQVVFKETSLEKGDFSYIKKPVTRYREWRLIDVVSDEPGNTEKRACFAVWREVVKSEGSLPEFELESGGFENLEGLMKLDRIPVAAAYGSQTGLFESVPPLLDLALRNFKHYQKESDNDNGLHIAGNPLLCFKNFDGDVAVVGANTALNVGTDGDIWYAEPSGASFSAARQSLEDVKSEIGTLGLSMLKAKTKTQITATESVLDSVQETSNLATMARSLQDAIETALQFHAEYLDLDSGGSVEFGVDLKSLVISTDELRLFSELVDKNQMTLENLVYHLQKTDRLRPSATVESEVKLLKAEPPKDVLPGGNSAK